MAAIDKYTRTTECCGGKGTARPLSLEESSSELLGHSMPLSEEKNAPDPCPDWLLLPFWAHYIEGDPHLLPQVRLRQLQKTKERVLLIT